jgi:hypothetical protein
MNFLFSVVRFFPYWALPVVLVLAETALFAKRRNRRKLMWGCVFFVFVFLGVIGSWFIYRGDVNSNQWVKDFVGES